MAAPPQCAATTRTAVMSAHLASRLSASRSDCRLVALARTHLHPPEKRQCPLQSRPAVEPNHCSRPRTSAQQKIGQCPILPGPLRKSAHGPASSSAACRTPPAGCERNSAPDRGETGTARNSGRLVTGVTRAATDRLEGPDDDRQSPSRIPEQTGSGDSIRRPGPTDGLLLLGEHEQQHHRRTDAPTHRPTKQPSSQAGGGYSWASRRRLLLGEHERQHGRRAGLAQQPGGEGEGPAGVGAVVDQQDPTTG